MTAAGIARPLDPGRILVIKLAALGDFVQAFGPFAAIRAHHPGAAITLLTTPPYAELARLSPWFDAVWIDGRPAWSDPAAIWRLFRRLRGAGFARVYDLQTSARTSRYRWMVGRGAEWSGIARGASHPHANPLRDLMHTAERQREQLEMAGITAFPTPELGWLEADVADLGLPPRYALLIPGASPLRPGKRWPVGHFAALAAGLDHPVAVARRRRRWRRRSWPPRRAASTSPAAPATRHWARSPAGRNSRWATTPDRRIWLPRPAARRWRCSGRKATRRCVPRGARRWRCCSGRAWRGWRWPRRARRWRACWRGEARRAAKSRRPERARRQVHVSGCWFRYPVWSPAGLDAGEGWKTRGVDRGPMVRPRPMLVPHRPVGRCGSRLRRRRGSPWR
jgi:hypothetical protein